tara:strand:+ start:7935 stop:8420 length:486 start_codon:yes stop_codon:yes gene_type:complete
MKNNNESKKTIGFNINQPKETCTDVKCPFHGSLKVRGKTFTGIVIKNAFHKDATIEFLRSRKIGKYQRFEKRRSRIKAYNPECINATKGSKVKIMECRPLSKTKNFVVVESLGKDYLFSAREEALAESKVKDKPKEEPESATKEEEKKEKEEKEKSEDKKE